ncbi:FtsK/SpoIIIE domain-containing protein [Arthrobacter sp. SDTb3-6]|uniref:FtsK/SpoIIIE domain-containing protein n=1 Tax=Arthrobacter sp. SDTb3-6 TaxID=2713571 RepID=UPI00159EA760|nr:hypothetical protein [Arthrobacter sp. SDTb3-6]
MRLEITAVAGPGTDPFDPAELSIFLPDGMLAEGHLSAADLSGGAAVAGALNGRWPGAAFTVAGLPLDRLRAGRPPLTDGAVVVVHGTAPAPAGGRHPSGPDAPAQLAVCSGPGAGAIFPLHRGSYGLGRGRCRISIADPALSRRQGTLTVGERAIVLEAAPGATGFSLLRGWQANPLAAAVAVKGPAIIEVGDLIRCGATGLLLQLSTPVSTSTGRCAMPGGNAARTGGRSGTGNVGATLNEDGQGDAGRSGETGSLGHGGAGAPGLTGGTDMDRPSGVSGPLLGARDFAGLLDAGALAALSLPARSGQLRNRWGTLATGLLPLAVGVLLAWLTGSLMFLAFAAMGAVAVISPLVGGARDRRGFRASVAMAAVQNAARRLAAFPGADELFSGALQKTLPDQPLAGPGGSGRTGLQAPDPGQGALPFSGRRLALRVGTAHQCANLDTASAGPGLKVPVLTHSPVTVPLGQGPVQICGAAGPLRLLLHFVLMQLDAAGVPVVLLASAGDQPLAARFLPGTVLSSGRLPTPAAPPVPPGGVVVTFDEPQELVRAAYPGTAAVFFFTRAVEHGTAATGVRLHLQGDTACGLLDGLSFVPDGVPAEIFDRYARARAGSGRHEVAADPLAPCSVPLPGRCRAHQVVEGWRASAGGPLRPVPVGRSAAGQEMFSFAQDGPHLLVGGTTGSGKSEFLRTLAGSLALEHSPADLEFILVDFKGGAGLGALRKFPHTSALVTDLDGHGMDRVLASLRTEIHRRETLLGAAEAANADSYRARRAAGSIFGRSGGGGMAHLVIMVDEFRVLVDQYPDAMGELMRIAAVGRSLGIHLVLATQRPQGAVSADIRANVTSSVCLRVQTSLDSQDVIGSGAASCIAVDTPGRAFISRAGARPTEFQSATLRLPDARGPLHAVVSPVAELLAGPQMMTALPSAPLPPSPGSAAPVGGTANESAADSDVDSVAGLLIAAWQMLSSPGTSAPPANETAWQRGLENGAATTPGRSVPVRQSPWRPAPAIVAPELPSGIDLDALTSDNGAVTAATSRHVAAGSGTDGGAVLLGLVDVPERQSLEPLVWSPLRHSHVACLGARDESSAGVQLLASRLLAPNTRRDGSLPHYAYLLDGDGSLQHLRRHPRVGGYVTPASLRTAARLLLRLQEVAERTESRMVLFATDWGRWVAAFRSGAWPWAEDCAAALVGHSRPTVAVVVGGERELLTAPFMAGMPNRLFLPFGTSTESRLAWPGLPRFTPVPGRAAVFGPINAAASRGAPEEPHVAQLGAAAPPGRGLSMVAEREGGHPPLVVRDLPSTLTLAVASAALAGASAAAGPGATAGVGNTGAGAGTARDTFTGVPPTTAPGPTAVWDVMVGLGGDCGTPIWLSVAPGTVIPVLGAPGSGRSSFLAAVRELNAGRGRLLWVDDATRLTPEQCHAISRQVADGGSALVAVPNHLPSLSRLPPEWGVRTAEQGVVLRPRRQQDGELFGLRLDTMGSEPAGRAVLVDRGRTTWFQFPAPRQGAP